MPNRILIVDDEPDLRTVMRLALEGGGYELEEAGSGEEVLARLRDGIRWDVVVLDHRLPGIDGARTLEGIREIDPSCTVLMVTAFASIDLAVEAMKLGARDFVQKPMTPETLRAAVSTALSKARGEWVPPPSPLPTHRAWEVWTMNGFHVVDARDPVSDVEHRYEIVQGRDGPRHPVAVRFAPRVVGQVAAEGGRALAADRQFWMRQGGLALAHYVWAHAAPPSDGRLEVEQATGELLRQAAEAAEALYRGQLPPAPAR
jgi:DNA-binding response OmpR family regulator